jgi:arylsulfate sulfotransferase
VLATLANDWLHANSLNYLPDSGNVLMSIRHQDWVVKIDYANGKGSGNVLWKLGQGGDFAIQSRDPYPWFSHQHDSQLDPATGTFLAFDNGNTRVAMTGGVGNSRGYVLQLDEANLTATPVMLADLGCIPSLWVAPKYWITEPTTSMRVWSPRRHPMLILSKSYLTAARILFGRN